MRTSRKLGAVGVSLAVVALAVLAVRAWAVPSEGGNEQGRIRGNVEYTVRDSGGRVKAHQVLHNTVPGEGLETAMRRLIDGSVQTNTAGADDGATANRTDTFRRIVAITATSGVDAPGDGWLAGSVTLTLDGDAVAAGNQNPANGVYADVGTTTDGQGRVQVTFTAAANGVVIRQIGLVKTPVDDTATGGAVAIPIADILAYRDINVTLDNLDTLQITWTVDLNP